MLSTILSWSLSDFLLGQGRFWPLAEIELEKSGHFLFVFVLNLLQTFSEFSLLCPCPFYFPFPGLDGLICCTGEGNLRFVWPPARTAYVTAILYLPRRQATSLPIPMPYFIVNDILLLQDTKLPGSLAEHEALESILRHQSACNKSQMFFCTYKNGLKTYLTGCHGKVFEGSSIILWCCSIPF